MKVDKAVCTNGTLDDLVETLKYKALFTALIQKKILANKTDYEQSVLTKKKRRKTTTFGRCFFRKRWLCRRESESRGDAADVKRCQTTNGLRKRFFRRRPKEDNLALHEFDDTRRIPKKCDLNLAHNPFDNNIPLSSLPRLHKMAAMANDNLNLNSTDTNFADTSSEPICYDIDNSPSSLIRNTNSNNNAKITVITNHEHDNDNHDDDDADGRHRSLESMPYLTNTNTNATNTYQTTMKRSRQRHLLLEAKSISAQCSPVLLRHPLPAGDSNRSHMVVTDSTGTKSQLLRSACTLYDERDTTTPSCFNESGGAMKSTSLVVISSRHHNHEDVALSTRSRTTSSKIVTSRTSMSSNNCIPNRVRRPSATVSESQVLYVEERAQLYRKSSTSSESSVTLAKFYSAPVGSSKMAAAMLPSWRSAISEEEYMRQQQQQQRHKRYQRNSDPVIVSPPAGDLQQCVLSMPRSAIHMNYAQDAICDMTLEVDSSKNELKTLVEKNHKRNHRRHRHKKHRRYKKSKLLVRNVDAEHLKVIDPDDLSKRARWTIIATACLLLLMCLMLVGITLRMAPIIDEMVRQENERLMKESMSFDRFANYTGADAFFAANEIA